jgi:hypothetical protein
VIEFPEALSLILTPLAALPAAPPEVTPIQLPDTSLLVLSISHMPLLPLRAMMLFWM